MRVVLDGTCSGIYAKQVLFASMPISIFVVSKLVWLSMKCIHMCVRKRAYRAKGMWLTMSGNVSEEASIFVLHRQDCFNRCGFFLLLYPTMVKQAISLFVCDAIGDKWYFIGGSTGGMPCWKAFVVDDYVWPSTGWCIRLWDAITRLFDLACQSLAPFTRNASDFVMDCSTVGTGGGRSGGRVLCDAKGYLRGHCRSVLVAHGPDLQCFVALLYSSGSSISTSLRIHLTRFSSRHRVLHHMETWALIVAWCTMWMGLIFYLGNEFGRINRDWMVVFTISIIVMNVLYSTVVLTLFFKEYGREKVEAHKAKEHDKLAHKLAAHMYHQTQIQANMMSNEQAESRHSLDPRRVGRNSAGGSILGDKLKAAGMGAGKAGAAPKDLLADSAASILKFQNTKLSKTKSTRQARRMQKMLTKRQMTKQQMEDMDRMLIGQRALESVSETIRSKGEKLAKIKAEHVYQKGRLKRRIKVRMLQRKMGVTLKESASGPSSLFGKILSRNRNKIAKRIKVLLSLNASMHKMRHENCVQATFASNLGYAHGHQFQKSRDGQHRNFQVKKGNSMCPAEGRSVLKMGDILIDVNGKDVRGLLASEAKSAYRSELREQSNRSMSEDPPMWYLIFRRGTEGEMTICTRRLSRQSV